MFEGSFGSLFFLGVLVLRCEFMEELGPHGGNIVSILQGVDSISDASFPSCDLISLNESEGQGYMADMGVHARHSAI